MAKVSRGRIEISCDDLFNCFSNCVLEPRWYFRQLTFQPNLLQKLVST